MILAGFVKFFKKGSVPVSKRKKIIMLILVIVLLCSLSINAFAISSPSMEESARQGRMLTPFSLTYHADVDVADSSYGFVFGLPNYYLTSSDIVSSTLSQRTVYDIDGLEVGMRFFGEPYPNSDLFDGSAMTHIDLVVESIGGSFSDDGYFMLQDCFLWPDISVDTYDSSLNPGTIFAIYQESYRDFYAEGYSRGEFFLPGVDQQFTYNIQNTVNYGAFLNYYQVLCYSNVPWADYLPDTYDTFTIDEFLAAIEVAKLGGFEDMSDDQIRLLDMLFSWVGPIYGRFEVSGTDYSNDSNSFSYYISYSLTDFTVLEGFYERNVQESRFNGLTGFERMTKFLGSAVNGFMSLEIMPNFSLGGILVVLITFSIVLWWLKVFAGG